MGFASLFSVRELFFFPQPFLLPTTASTQTKDAESLRAQHVAHVYLIKSHRMTKLDHLSSPWLNFEISSEAHRMSPHSICSFSPRQAIQKPWAYWSLIHFWWIGRFIFSSCDIELLLKKTVCEAFTAFNSSGIFISHFHLFFIEYAPLAVYFSY